MLQRLKYLIFFFLMKSLKIRKSLFYPHLTCFQQAREFLVSQHPSYTETNGDSVIDIFQLLSSKASPHPVSVASSSPPLFQQVRSWLHLFWQVPNSSNLLCIASCCVRTLHYVWVLPFFRSSFSRQAHLFFVVSFVIVDILLLLMF